MLPYMQHEGGELEPRIQFRSGSSKSLCAFHAPDERNETQHAAACDESWGGFQIVVLPALLKSAN
jgi:hypothetical protein